MLPVLHRSRAATPWYYLAGVAPIIAYQPKGAASLAASYVNLANPGTYNAAPGVAPTFSAATGWTFDGATQYLTTQYTPVGTFTGFIQFSNWTPPGLAYLFGESDGIAEVFGVFTGDVTTSHGYIHGTVASSVMSVTSSGNLALSSAKGYYNGTSDAAVTGAALASSYPLYIAARDDANTPSSFSPVKIQAFALYSGTISDANVAIIAAAMAAL